MNKNRKDIKDRKAIELLIDTFYDKVRKDETLAYIFDDIAKVDWENHLPVMYDFWETTLFHTGSYKRNAMQPHLDLNEKIPLKKLHFDQWLKLFNETVDELFEGEIAHNAKTRALSIATMMQIKISKGPGSLL